jgi:hypothetical protein
LTRPSFSVGITCPEPKTTKNRMHLDLETPDIDTEAIRLEALGERRAQDDHIHERGSTWILMTVPEGNEFCVCDNGAGNTGADQTSPS